MPFWDERLLSCCSEAISILLSVLNPEVSVPYGPPRPGELALTTSFSHVLQPPAAETSHIRVLQERLLRGLQNDIHHTADSLPGAGKAPASNLTAAVTEANEEELGKRQLQGLRKSLATSTGMSGREERTSLQPLPGCLRNRLV